jgi:hypothetical protein
MTRGVVLALLGASGLLAGCTGSSATTCGEVEPCGGDVVGSWSIVNSCLSANGMFSTDKQAFFAGFCAGGTNDDLASANWSGAWSFDAQMAYSVSILETVHESFTCADSETCATLDTEIKAAQAMYPTMQASGCQPGKANGVCACTVDWATFQEESGIYASQGTALSLAPSSNLPTATIGFCVQGSTMHWIPTDSVAGGPPFPDIVAVRR